MMADPVTRLGALRRVDWETALTWVDRRLPHPLAERQRAAVRQALTHKVSVLTGGPGTGKTTTVRAILELLAAKGGTVRLAAPTGRAAKRLRRPRAWRPDPPPPAGVRPSDGKLFKRDDNPSTPT
jgi:exodeoxyribonuclease V alpha subunit